MKSLKSLYLNDVRSVSGKLFEGMASLEKLTIWKNNSNDIDLVNSINLPNLKSLTLAQNNLASIPQGISELNSLEQLEIIYNQIQQIDNENFKNLNKLKKLDLSYNRINKISNRTFEFLTDLVELNLSTNELSFIETRYVSGVLQTC